MSESVIQNFFVGNDAHWENIYECNAEGKFYKESETDFVVCNYTPTRSIKEECEFISSFPEIVIVGFIIAVSFGSPIASTIFSALFFFFIMPLP